MKKTIPPPILAALFGLLMWFLSINLPHLNSNFFIRNWLVIMLIIAAALIEITTLIAFLRAQTTISPMKPHNASSLVVSGLYRVSRNPMYTGLLLFLSAWGLWLGNPLNLLWLILFVWLITELQIKPEEKALREKFGEEYNMYCDRVRRWL